MTYNIHPIVVHFPIAFLFLYSIIKIFPFRKHIPNFSWADVEKILILFGVLGIYVARMTGEIAHELVSQGHDNPILEKHEFFSGVTLFLYIILLITSFSSDVCKFDFVPLKLKGLLTRISQKVENRMLGKLLAFLGLVSLTITGLLGGVMVYGLSADPLAPFILKILGLSL